MLRKSDTPLEVQQQLMWHANIQTTIGYGGEMQVEEKRPANTKVVEMLRRAS